MRKECEGCVFWRGLFSNGGASNKNKICHYCIDTGVLETISKDGKCLSRMGNEE